MSSIEELTEMDNVFEKARAAYGTGAYDDATLEFLFPQLKESEDERTRKWILEYLYDGLRKSDEQFKEQFKSAIDWLEKQKEQPVPDIFQNGNNHWTPSEEQIEALKDAALKLCETVERYTNGAALRSELLNTVNATRLKMR